MVEIDSGMGGLEEDGAKSVGYHRSKQQIGIVHPSYVETLRLDSARLRLIRIGKKSPRSLIDITYITGAYKRKEARRAPS